MLCLCSAIKLWHQYSRYKPVTAMNSFYSSSGNGLGLFMLSFVRYFAIAGDAKLRSSGELVASNRWCVVRACAGRGALLVYGKVAIAGDEVGLEPADARYRLIETLLAALAADYLTFGRGFPSG